MNCTHAANSRRNLTKTYDRRIREDTHAEELPLRYRLHYLDGARNIKTDRLGLLAEIRETRPIMIERIILKSDVGRLASMSEHLKFMGCVEVIEVCDL